MRKNRNKYKLSRLEKYNDSFNIDEKVEIFFKMLDFLKGDFSSTDSVDDLSNIMEDGNYFVAHKYVVYKGKRRFYNGDLAISSKKLILEFIKKDIEDGDLRPLLISPIFEDTPLYVIYVHEDIYFTLHKGQNVERM